MAGVGAIGMSSLGGDRLLLILLLQTLCAVAATVVGGQSRTYYTLLCSRERLGSWGVWGFGGAA
jgi:hypothetical protein